MRCIVVRHGGSVDPVLNVFQQVPNDLQPVLSSEPDASWARKGRARSAADLTPISWSDHRASGSRRAASPLRAAGRVTARPAACLGTVYRPLHVHPLVTDTGGAVSLNAISL